MSSPQQELSNYCASQQIDLQFCQWPEIRFELLNGQFLVGGTLAGSRWLLQEALLGWGLEAAIAFAPLDRWWEALRQAYTISCQTEEEWWHWAESLPLSSLYRQDYSPLGSKYTGEHRWIRDHLGRSLRMAIDPAHWGYCGGPHYGMQMGADMFTPDLTVWTVQQLSQDVLHDYYVEVPAHLVIEILLPEQRALDEQVRYTHYERARVLHYWTVDPIERSFKFWRWTPEGYLAKGLDADGCYRGIADLSFSPDIFWLRVDQDLSPFDRKLPAFICAQQPRQWHIGREPGTELSYGSVPFAPTIGLDPEPISVEQFVSWCPETKLESPPFPLLGSETGTRNTIAMVLMSLGLVETVKLVAGYEWVRVLHRLTREQQTDPQQREQWWQRAREIAEQLQQEQGVRGIGVIGDLVEDRPLNRWSEIQLILWEIPEDFNLWACWQSLPQDIPIALIELVRELPGTWSDITERMVVLVGQWTGQTHRPQKRMQFRWQE